MKIYPAIDIIEGKVVRLSQGRFEQKIIYNNDPLTVARMFADEGAEYLHLIDLDGARQGKPRQLDLLGQLAKEVPLKLQIGGGVRSSQDVAQLIDAGADRVIIGSLAIQNFHLTQNIIEQFGSEHITLGLDLCIDSTGVARVATHGWQELSTIIAEDLLLQYLPLGINQVLCTDISLDGMMQGPNFKLYQNILLRFPGICLLASGGIRNKEDILQLKCAGLGGAIIGKALYEGGIQLKELIKC